jgi:hypothetical protein
VADQVTRRSRGRGTSQNGHGSAANGGLTLTPLSRALGVSVRTLERAAGARVIEPVRRGRGTLPALYDPVDVARRLLAHRGQSPRDERERAQARLLQLRYQRERGEVLSKAEWIRLGQALTAALAAKIRALPNRLARAGVLTSAREPETLAACDEMLREIARWTTEADLVAAAGEHEPEAADAAELVHA